MSMNEYFNQEMRSLLGDEYEAFEKARNSAQTRAIRINNAKSSYTDLNAAGFSLGEKTPFNSDTYYLECEEKLGNHPFHIGGCYYLQEPSSSIVSDVLDVKSGDMVLDLCAAPGGKSTQILSKLDGKGLLWANEINRQRCVTLLSNIERWGYDNYVISNNSPDELARSLKNSFDKVLVDAPCSGSSMFKKFPETEQEYNEASVKACQKRQLEIMDKAYEMLKEGGVLVYSTCTFNLKENEECLALFMDSHPDMHAIDCGVDWDRRGFDVAGHKGSYYRRVFPMDGGEGHFVAKMVKEGNESLKPLKQLDFSHNKVLDDFLKEYGIDSAYTIVGDNVYLCHQKLINSSLRIMRQGILLGTISKDRLELHHHFAVALLSLNNFNNIYEASDEEIEKYLKGESLNAKTAKGYVIIKYRGINIGLGKSDGRQIKNHLPKGLRVR